MTDAKKLETELKNIGEGAIALLETSAENALQAGIEVVKILAGSHDAGLILSASRPCTNLLSLYKTNGIDTKNITVICSVCASQGVDAKSTAQIIHAPSASALTEISINLNENMKKSKNKKFVFIDSITTMLIHNKPGTIAVFIHSILTRMRINNISGILIYLESETNKEVRAEIAQLCDKVIKF